MDKITSGTRIRYAAVTLFVIFLGLASRKIPGIPMFTGDLLYAVMVYFLLRIGFPKTSHHRLAVAAFFICVTIELLQLSDAPILVSLRADKFARLVLGQGFLWSDVLAYAVGVIAALLADTFLIIPKNKQHK